MWTAILRRNPEHAWVAKVPTWPLTLAFLGQVVAIGGGVYWVVKNSKLLLSSECCAELH